ncbi:hypothetical protein [Idiomarina xiamenensis]|uniref:Thioredoxin domain-containing protein n=1 Tax=Idiomarina xiamenensis 10-D-4 TaxID=740709 RepID=K2KYR2_9GAMM|nr:hypothetical protein [Idiomarina xiamenensis]EKE87654.1 hypothetical protein A10D4_01130 [Idiomarina xiamenensis 10-D-4]
MTITELCLCLLTLALLFNFVLLWRVISAPAARQDSASSQPLTLAIGSTVMAVSAYRRAAVNAAPHADAFAKQALVSLPSTPTLVVFLSARCHSCRGKVPQLQQLLAAIQAVELSFWLVVIEAHDDAADFLRDSPLWPYVMSMPPEVIKYLNPRTASPFYLMLNEQRQLQASGMLDDADWQSFVEQMQAVDAELSQPSQ